MYLLIAENTTIKTISIQNETFGWAIIKFRRRKVQIKSLLFRNQGTSMKILTNI